MGTGSTIGYPLPLVLDDAATLVYMTSRQRDLVIQVGHAPMLSALADWSQRQGVPRRVPPPDSYPLFPSSSVALSTSAANTDCASVHLQVSQFKRTTFNESVSPIGRNAFLTVDDLAPSARALDHSIRAVHPNHLIDATR